MKIRLIADRYDGMSGYTVGNIYSTAPGRIGYLLLKDDNGKTRFINESLRGNYWDWEIVEL